MTKLLFAGIPAVCLFALSPAPADAQVWWTGDGSGASEDWFSAANWNQGVPSSADEVFINTDGTSPAPVLVRGAEKAECADLNIAYGEGSYGELTVEGSLETAVLWAGRMGTGAVNVLPGGVLRCTGAVIGDLAGSDGTVTVSGGVFDASGTVTLGSDNSSGSMTVSGGGSARIGGSLKVGRYGDAASGYFLLDGGSVSVTNGQVTVCESTGSTGVLEIRSGVFTAMSASGSGNVSLYLGGGYAYSNDVSFLLSGDGAFYCAGASGALALKACSKSGARAYMELSGSSRFEADGSITLAAGGGTECTLVVRDNALLFHTNGIFRVLDAGSPASVGRLIVEGGTVILDGTQTQFIYNNSEDGYAELIQTGGNISAASHVLLGLRGRAAARFSGGSAKFGKLSVGGQYVPDGVFSECVFSGECRVECDSLGIGGKLNGQNPWTVGSLVLDGAVRGGGADVAVSGNAYFSNNKVKGGYGDDSVEGGRSSRWLVVVDDAAVLDPTSMRKLDVAGNLSFESGTELIPSFSEDGRFSPAGITEWTVAEYGGKLSQMGDGLVLSDEAAADGWDLIFDEDGKRIVLRYTPFCTLLIVQ